MLILLSLLACSTGSEPETAPKPSLPDAQPQAPEPAAPPAEAPTPVDEPQDPPAEVPDAPPPEPVLLNALDQNVSLPIYRHQDVGCYVLVPIGPSEGGANPMYRRIPTECPEEMLWESWDSCRQGEIWQVGEPCECRIMVGQPKPEPTPIACPTAPESDTQQPEAE